MDHFDNGGLVDGYMDCIHDSEMPWDLIETNENIHSFIDWLISQKNNLFEDGLRSKNDGQDMLKKQSW
jgi:hypothetical protein